MVNGEGDPSRCLGGYRVQTCGGGRRVGEVGNVRHRGIVVGMSVGGSRAHRHFPVEAIAWVSDVTNTVFLVAGVDVDRVAGARLGESGRRRGGPPGIGAGDGSRGASGGLVARRCAAARLLEVR